MIRTFFLTLDPFFTGDNTMKRLMLKTLVAATALALCGTVALAQDIKERTIKFTNQKHQDHLLVIGME